MNPTQKDLELAASDVTYELQNLVGSLRANEWVASQMKRTTGGRSQALWRVLSNSTQEAFLLHYRNLKQFLNNQKYATDVKAGHYSDSWRSSSNVVGELDEDDRLNRRLAHISYDRKNLTKNWDDLVLEDRICQVFSKFLTHVRPQYESYFHECKRLLDDRKAGPPVVLVSNGTETATTLSVEAFGTFGIPFPVE